MTSLSKLTGLAVFAISLSGCAFTQGVAQNVYDNKAEKDCRVTSGANDSIHTRANSNCAGGRYDPAPRDITKIEPSDLEAE